MPSRSAAPDDAARLRPAALDELRRRVYGPDATDADRERYRVALDAAASASEAPSTEQAAHDERRDGSPGAADVPASAARRRRLLIAAAVVAVLVIALIGGLLVQRSAGPTLTAPTPLRVGEADRSAFVENLRGGGAAGIAAYLVTHRSTASLDSTVPLQTVERDGTGPRTVPLFPVDATAGAGRATVILVVDQGADVEWSAYRLVRSGSAAPRLALSARRGGQQDAGEPTTAAVSYGSAARPVQLRIVVPAGVRWGVEVEYDG